MNYWSDNRPPERGVTLLEMLAVLAILSMATVLFATMSSRIARRADAIRFAEVLAADIRRARADALAANDQIYMTFDVDDGAYSLEEAQLGRAPPNVSLEFTGASEYFTPAGDGVLRLYSDGSTSGALIKIQSERETDTITVDWLTGTVRLARERRQ